MVKAVVRQAPLDSFAPDDYYVEIESTDGWRRIVLIISYAQPHSKSTAERVANAINMAYQQGLRDGAKPCCIYSSSIPVEKKQDVLEIIS